MSSQQTKSELHPVKSAKPKFVRTSSLQRIKKFNSFICSQHYYYILPALLAWLKSSQRSVEQCIATVKSSITSSVVSAKMLVFLAYDAVNCVYLRLQTRILTFVVYLTVVAIFTQLVACVYFLTSVFLPVGLIFMLSCLYLISHINLQCLNYFMEQHQQPAPTASATPKTPRLSRRDILGKRTISNFNFF